MFESISYGKKLGEGIARACYEVAENPRFCVKRSVISVTDPQTIREVTLWKEMEDYEKEYTPFVGTKVIDGVLHIVMKKVIVLSKLLRKRIGKDTRYRAQNDLEGIRNTMQKAGLHFARRHFDCLGDIIDKYGLTDLHSCNLGVMGDRLVLLDFGYDPFGENRVYYSDVYYCPDCEGELNFMDWEEGNCPHCELMEG